MHTYILLFHFRNIDLTVQQPTIGIDWDCISSSSDHEEDEKLDKTCNPVSSVNSKLLKISEYIII